MSRNPINASIFIAGLAVLVWIGAGYAGSNPLALTVILLIGACYVAGAVELHRHRQATATLVDAIANLAAPPPTLAAWLDRLHPSLRHAVRLRIENERTALPGPALAPYFTGLLVLLGMLGTLLGMVITLKGTGMALDSATDLQAMRASLAAPVKGLGFAFGTSVAGVATSATLGLLAALSRRERIEAARLLDAQIATTLRIYSPAHQRDEAFKLLQRQVETMPALADRLQTMMTAMEQHSVAISERQMKSQDAFHRNIETGYARLATSIAQSFEASAAESAKAAGAALQPVVETTMTSLAREAATLQGNVAQAVQRQLDAMSDGFDRSTAGVAAIWSQALADHQRSSEALAERLRASLDRFAETLEQRLAGQLDELTRRNEQALSAAATAFEQRCASLAKSVGDSHARLQGELASRDQERLAAWTDSLSTMSAALTTQWKQAGEAAASRQEAICEALAQAAREVSAQTQTHARETIAEISRLVQAASEAPKAAAEAIAELREKLSESMARDTAMLEERTRLMATLETLLDAVNRASTEQRSAIEALVATSSDLLAHVGARFSETVETRTSQLAAATEEAAASAAEVASLGEAFGVAVKLFGESNDKLVAHLERIEAALDKSLARSDEQLAYYVAQAREVIDLSMLSQKQIVEDLQQLAAQRASTGATAA